MPRGPLPPELLDVVRRPQLGVIATLRPDGSPHTVATWYDVEDDGTVLVNMDASRQRLRHMRDDPRVSLTVLEARNWYRHVSLLGRVARIEDDPDLVGIDRLARRYTGSPFGRRDARRVSAWIAVDSWHAWDDSGPWNPAG
jgi:PPOX class probable F420-dependent enzyme